MIYNIFILKKSLSTERSNAFSQSFRTKMLIIFHLSIFLTNITAIWYWMCQIRNFDRNFNFQLKFLGHECVKITTFNAFFWNKIVRISRKNVFFFIWKYNYKSVIIIIIITMFSLFYFFLSYLISAAHRWAI